MRTHAEISGLLRKLLQLSDYARQKAEEAANPNVREMWQLRNGTIIDQIVALRWVVENDHPWPNEIWYAEANEWLQRRPENG